jgi:DNA modification methylase
VSEILGAYALDEIYPGDARVMCAGIPDASIDLIFTDPPYLGEYVPLYEFLTTEAARILKPDGFLLMYVGGYWKDDIMANTRKTLEYFWDYIVWEPNNSPINWPRKTIARNKSILAYRPKGGTGLPITQVLSVWLGGGEDKRFHLWGQCESEARYFIDCFSRPGDVVLDICAGGGTTPAVCKMLGRHYLAFEIERDVAEAARARVANAEEFIALTNTDLPLLFEAQP